MHKILLTVVTLICFNAGTALGFFQTAEIVGVNLNRDHRTVHICYRSEDAGCGVNSEYCKDKEVSFELDKGAGKEIYSAALTAMAMNTRLFLNVTGQCLLDTVTIKR